MLDTKTEVQKYYGQTLKNSDDLKTNACCTVVDYPNKVKAALAKIHDEVLTKYYGCGLCVPEVVEGTRVLDLGSGSGRDCYILSSLVGESGSVVGVDMTKEQLDVSRKHLEFHRNAFGYKKSNVEFLEGDLNKLENLDFAENSFDIVISNCVINLVENKKGILEQVFRVLKPGGEFYFSDVYCDRRIPKHLVDDPVLYGECLSGALYQNDFENLAKEIGFADPRIVETAPITVNNKNLESKIKGFNFTSITYRLFKISELEPHCEDYGQAVCYKGGLSESDEEFLLDSTHLFKKGKIELVCGNSYRMLNDTRFKPYFEFFGSWDTHFGLFDCGPKPTTSTSASEATTDSGCC